MTREHDVTVEVDGEATTVSVAEDEYVLDAALAAGLDMPYSCRSGNCTTCAGELRDGDVEREGMALEPEQRADGYVLLCSAYPRADCRIRAGEDVQRELLGLDLL